MSLRARLSGPAGPLLGAAVGLLIAVTVTLLQDSVYRADASILLVRQGQPPGSDPRLARGRGRCSRALREPRGRGVGDPEPRPRRDGAGAARPARRRGPRRQLARSDRSRGAEQGAGAAHRSGGGRGRDGALQRPLRPGDDSVGVGARERRRATCVAEAGEEPRARHPDRGARGPRLRDRRPLPRSSFAAAARGRRRLRRRRAPRRRARHRPRRRLRSQPRRPSLHRHSRRRPARSSLPRFGEWTVGDVERLLAEQGDAFPEQREEFELYLDTFRSVAGPDGRLPGEVDLVIEDVFADLIERAR